MGREQMFAVGRLQPVGEPTEVLHGFDKVSKLARQDPELSHRAFRVLATLEGYCWGDDRHSWATNRTIGRQSGGIGVNAVRLALRELEARGYITIVPDPSKMRGSRIVLTYWLKRPERRPDAEE